MNRMTQAGLGVSVASLTLFFVGQLNDFSLADAVARYWCGDEYQRVVDGLLSDQACGFDADMQLIALCALGLVVGVILLIAGVWRSRRKRSSHTE